MKPRVLIVDDDLSILKFVKANLAARDYEVETASDGDEALQKINLQMPDLILLDVMMPQLDGFQVCSRIREKSSVPIIMISARDDDEDKIKVLNCGADDYLTKPFALRELLSRIKAILRRSMDDRAI